MKYETVINHKNEYILSKEPLVYKNEVTCMGKKVRFGVVMIMTDALSCSAQSVRMPLAEFPAPFVMWDNMPAWV